MCLWQQVIKTFFTKSWVGDGVVVVGGGVGAFCVVVSTGVSENELGEGVIQFGSWLEGRGFEFQPNSQLSKYEFFKKWKMFAKFVLLSKCECSDQ